MPQLGSPDPQVDGREGKKYKEGSLGRGVQGLFICHFKHCTSTSNKCKKTYQFKTRCKDDMVISDI